MYFTGIVFGAIADSAQCVDGVKDYTLAVSSLGLISFIGLFFVCMFIREDRASNSAQVHVAKLDQSIYY
jgi:hypothetical protein